LTPIPKSAILGTKYFLGKGRGMGRCGTEGGGDVIIINDKLYCI